MNTIKLFLLTISMLCFIDSSKANNNLIDTLIRSENHIIFLEDGKWGIMNLEEVVVHTAEFEDIDRFSNNNVPVKLNGVWGLWSEGEIDFDSELMVFHIVDTKPRYKVECIDESDVDFCDYRKLMQYIYQRIYLPDAAREKRIEEKALVKYLVKKNGDTSNFEIVREVCRGCGDEALRVLKTIEYYDVPAYKDGIMVSTWITIPINFAMER